MQVPQGREIFGAMTVRENLEMGASTQNDLRSIENDIEEMLNLFLRCGRSNLARLGRCAAASNNSSRSAEH